MKKIKSLREEIIPLSSRQNLVLLIIIACIFQFVLFYAPVLANSAIAQTQTQNQLAAVSQVKEVKNFLNSDDLIANEIIIKYEELESQIHTIQALYGPEGDPITTYQGQTRGYQQAQAEATMVNKIISVSTHTLTAYNSDPRQTDDSPCITANGFNVCEHGTEDTIAANFLKFGTKVMIPELFGDRVFIVRDRMNKRYTSRVDIWMTDYQAAKNFGVKTAKIYVIE